MATAEHDHLASITREANATRTARKLIRQQLRAGDITLAELMQDPPAVIGGVCLVDLIRWQYASPDRGASITCIGREALTAGINLTLCVRDASPRTRAWVAQHGSRGFWGRRR